MSILEAIQLTGELPTIAELEGGVVIKLFRTMVTETDYTSAYWQMIGDDQGKLIAITVGRSQKEADDKLKKKILK